MKKIILYTVLMLIGSMTTQAQNLKHFRVDTSRIYDFWNISPNFDPEPESGGNKFVGDDTYHISKLVKEAVKTLPEKIRQVLIKYKVNAIVYFNSKGEIFYITFLLIQGDKFPMDDEQWLKVYHTLRHLKIDLSKLTLLENFEWGAGSYPLYRFLQPKP